MRMYVNTSKEISKTECRKFVSDDKPRLVIRLGMPQQNRWEEGVACFDIVKGLVWHVGLIFHDYIKANRIHRIYGYQVAEIRTKSYLNSKNCS